MPAPLTIRGPKVAPLRAQLAIGVLVLGPLFALWRLWTSHRDLHFDQPWLNLGAHAALIAIPLIWAFLLSAPRMNFEPTEEEFLGTSTFLDKLPADWWTMFLLWAPPVFAVFNLGQALFTQYLAYPLDLSTSPPFALAILVVTFALGSFYATLLLGNSEPRTLVSSSGVRTGLLRFFEWKHVHHVSRHGDLYSLHHQVNPALPATSFRLRDPGAQATFERYLTGQQIPLSNASPTAFTLIKVGVVAGFLLNLAFCFWLRAHTPLSALWITLISFAFGTILTLGMERFRGVSKFGKYMPVIEPPNENESPA